jgi:hypothetical protein
MQQRAGAGATAESRARAVGGQALRCAPPACGAPTRARLAPARRCTRHPGGAAQLPLVGRERRDRDDAAAHPHLATGRVWHRVLLHGAAPRPCLAARGGVGAAGAALVAAVLPRHHPSCCRELSPHSHHPPAPPPPLTPCPPPMNHQPSNRLRRVRARTAASTTCMSTCPSSSRWRQTYASWARLTVRLLGGVCWRVLAWLEAPLWPHVHSRQQTRMCQTTHTHTDARTHTRTHNTRNAMQRTPRTQHTQQTRSSSPAPAAATRLAARQGRPPRTCARGCGLAGTSSRGELHANRVLRAACCVLRAACCVLCSALCAWARA